MNHDCKLADRIRNMALLCNMYGNFLGMGGDVEELIENMLHDIDPLGLKL